MTKPRIAILGLGIMGSGMANRLLGAGFPLSVYNRNGEKAKAFAAAGAFVAGSPAEAAARSEIILSMLADDHASRSVWLGEGGAMAAAPPGSLVIESSTVTVGWIHELAAAAKQRGCEFLDAPVTGSKPQAASGELLFLVGGDEQALERARPVFAATGRDAIHFGPIGSGAAMKLINNFLCGVQVASFAEAMALMEANGLDRGKALSVLLNGAPASPLVKIISSRAEAGDFTPNFELKLMAKDLTYAGEEYQRALHAGLPSAKAAQEVFEKAIAGGYGDKDISAVIEFLATKSAAAK